jgi:cation:H+ antiporter
MDTLLNFALFFVGLVLLSGGAEILVRAAQKLSLMLGISPLIVGLTVVAFGTSAPEVAVSVNAALIGSADIVIGNIVGSNISNILLVLGLSAAFSPMIVSRKLVRIDVPIMIGVTIVMYAMARNGMVSLGESIILLLMIGIYLTYLILKERREKKIRDAEYDDDLDELVVVKSFRAYFFNTLYFFIGLALLVYGSDLLVDNAVALAKMWGVSELIIGLTIVSIGTSLPELATSVAASIKGERNLAVGNIVGSNIFNLLLVLGVTGLTSVDGVEVSSNAIEFDIPVMLAVSLACLPIFYRGYGIGRWEGIFFLFYYAAYVTYLVLDSISYEYLPVINVSMLYFVIPISVITVIVLAINTFRYKKNKDVPDVTT